MEDCWTEEDVCSEGVSWTESVEEDGCTDAESVEGGEDVEDSVVAEGELLPGEVAALLLVFCGCGQLNKLKKRLSSTGSSPLQHL